VTTPWWLSSPAGYSAQRERLPRPGSIDSTPAKLDGSPSTEFESDDIARAESASKEVRELLLGRSVGVTGGWLSEPRG